jgi:two-component system secretion response regulator SsrB
MNCYPCKVPIKLNDYQKRILTLIAEGYSATQIGKQLNKSPRTIEAHRDRLQNTLGAKNIVNLIAIAISYQHIQYSKP